MRIRTLLAFGTGLAVGATATYLADPDHGQERRGDAGRWALAQGREQAVHAARSATTAARSYTGAAVEGFLESVTSGTPTD